MDTFIEQLLTLPTPGVFAEAKLGNCNASELIDDDRFWDLIDDDRFWDWQKSAIPHQAPDIQPVDTNSRARDPQGLEPTAFPQSLVNIVSPQALPDPTGLAAALKVIGTPDLFRDMSASKEVGEASGRREPLSLSYSQHEAGVCTRSIRTLGPRPEEARATSRSRRSHPSKTRTGLRWLEAAR